MYGPSRYLGWSFAINLPGSSTVNGLTIDFERRSYLKKDLLDFLWNGTVSSRAEVLDKVSVLVNDII